MGEEQSSTQNQYKHQPYNYDPNFMSKRLDTEQLMKQIHITLTGQNETIKQDSNGNYISVIETIAEKPVNSIGYHRIMGYVGNIINPQTVQGFIKNQEDYRDYCSQTRQELADMLFDNALIWEVKDEDTMIITDSIMKLVKLFVTRLLDNTERISYGTTTITQNESVQQRKGWSV